jgi:hypothetical protein
MKTRRFDMALERERVEERASQATGLVSRIMVSREGGGTVASPRISKKLEDSVGTLLNGAHTVCDSDIPLCSINALHDA